MELIKLKKGEITQQEYDERLRERRRFIMSEAEKHFHSGDFLGGGNENPINERKNH